jgi:4-hydroxy-tetrahydrodipicolinate synthase
MSSPPPLLSGLFAPVVTPFKPDLSPDGKRLLQHCRWLLDRNCGLAVFGTNSEANSLSVDERIELLDMLLEAGIDPKRMMPGTGCSAFPDTVRLTAHAVAAGAGGVLMLPPFYYKGVSDEGLYRSFAEIFDRVGDSRLRVYLYHFPQMSAVPLGVDLIGRLREAYPEVVVGLKDSSGDRANLHALLRAFPGFGLFVGSEMLLLENLRAGGAGCISGTANLNPEAIDRLFRGWRSDGAEALQASLDDLRLAVQEFPLIPAIKKILSHYTGDPEWNRMRPPLVELSTEDSRKLVSSLEKIGFEMKGFPS